MSGLQVSMGCEDVDQSAGIQVIWMGTERQVHIHARVSHGILPRQHSRDSTAQHHAMVQGLNDTCCARQADVEIPDPLHLKQILRGEQ